MTNAINETVVTTNETVTPVAVETTVAPVAVETTVAEKVKVSKALEKIADADCSFDHSPLREIFAKDPAGLGAADAAGPLTYGWMTGKHDKLSDNMLKQVFKSVNCEVATVVIPKQFAAEFKELADRCNQVSLDAISDMAEDATRAKNSKKIDAESKAAQKLIEKEAKAAQKLIDDADKKAKKEAAKLAKEQADIAATSVAPVLDSGALDISGLFVGEDTVAPVAVVTSTVEADPILAAAIAAAQVNANMQAYADAPIIGSDSVVEAPVAMAAE